VFLLPPCNFSFHFSSHPTSSLQPTFLSSRFFPSLFSSISSSPLTYSYCTSPFSTFFLSFLFSFSISQLHPISSFRSRPLIFYCHFSLSSFFFLLFLLYVLERRMYMSTSNFQNAPFCLMASKCPVVLQACKIPLSA
jgi:hypothetical protein